MEKMKKEQEADEKATEAEVTTALQLEVERLKEEVTTPGYNCMRLN